MSEENTNKDAGDGAADAIAVTAIISLIVVAMYLWLGGMPS
ncbi:methionine synthase [Mangrovimicrobium sediminis]|nr:methionine synthase [Haliea sp. SAOS-164]